MDKDPVIADLDRWQEEHEENDINRERAEYLADQEDYYDDED